MYATHVTGVSNVLPKILKILPEYQCLKILKLIKHYTRSDVMHVSMLEFAYLEHFLDNWSQSMNQPNYLKQQMVSHKDDKNRFNISSSSSSIILNSIQIVYLFLNFYSFLFPWSKIRDFRKVTSLTFQWPWNLFSKWKITIKCASLYPVSFAHTFPTVTPSFSKVPSLFILKGNLMVIKRIIFCTFRFCVQKQGFI